jgi:hypothetical protein
MAENQNVEIIDQSGAGNMTSDSDVVVMCPPPEAIFTTRDELKDYLSNWAKSKGFILTITRSDKDKRLLLACDKGGTYRNKLNLTDDKRKRQTSCRKTNCPYSIKCLSKGCVWKFTVAFPNNNHPLEENLVGHSIARRMTTGQESLIISAIATGAPPRAALALAREQDPIFLASSQDVKNLKKKKRKDFLAGRSLIDNAIVLMQTIQESLPTVNQARAMVVQQHLHRAAEALSQPILPPVRQKTRGRPTGATNKTRRDPCGLKWLWSYQQLLMAQ